MASYSDNFGGGAFGGKATGKPSVAAHKAARARAEAAGMQEAKSAAEKDRKKTHRLKELRLARDAALPAKKKPAPRTAPKSSINLSMAQRLAKKR